MQLLFLSQERAKMVQVNSATAFDSSIGEQRRIEERV